MQGHYWTFRPFVAHMLRPLPPPPARHWRTSLRDSSRGSIRLTGRLSTNQGDELLLIVHGLGGSDSSHYAIRAARSAALAGMDSLRLNLRGADRSGDDIYHAGLTEDLRATLQSDSLCEYKAIYIVGYSLGGHVTLRYATEGVDDRVAAVAAICAPADLAAGVREIDKPRGAVYRAHVLRGLVDIYRECAAQGPVPIPVSEAERIRTIREWDEKVVAARFGFSSADDYYARCSAGPHLSQIDVPALTISAQADPMVFFHTVEPWLRRAPNVRSIMVERGGHVGFPDRTDLGLGLDGIVEDQVIQWLRSPK